MHNDHATALFRSNSVKLICDFFGWSLRHKADDHDHHQTEQETNCQGIKSCIGCDATIKKVL